MRDCTRMNLASNTSKPQLSEFATLHRSESGGVGRPSSTGMSNANTM